MTFIQLFEQFQKMYGQNHNPIFFDIVFYLSKWVKDKNKFLESRNLKLDFSSRKFFRLCNQYFKKEKPLAHITSHAMFCGLDMQIKKHVLAPRDITEQMTLDFINAHKNDTGVLLDLCCGSGCIGIAIKKHLPMFNVTCVDKYWGPIFNTFANANKHKAQIIIDRKDAIRYLYKQDRVDYLISNPPYIDSSNFRNIKMFKWENRNALIGKDNGLHFYKKYFAWLNTHDFKEAWLEIGYDLVPNLKQEIAKFPSIKATFCEKGYLVVKK